MENFDFLLPLKVPFQLLKIFGFWFDENASKSYKMYGILLHVILADLFVIGQFVEFFRVDGLFVKTLIIAVSFTFLGASIKTKNVMIVSKKIVEIIADLKEIIALLDSNVSDLRILKGKSRQVTKFFWVYWIMCLIVISWGSFIPWINYFQNPEPPYKLLYPTWSPFNHEQNIFGFVIVSFYESLTSGVFCGVVVAEDIFPVYFFNIISGMLQELNERISYITKKRENSGNGESTGKRTKHDEHFMELLRCVEIHHRIKKVIQKVENIFSAMIVIQGIMSVILICTIAFTLSKMSIMSEPSLFIFMFTYMVPMILEIFLPCYFGNEVSLASQKFSTTLFHIDWIEEDKNFKSAMKMVLENTKTPIKIAAAQGVFPVNLWTFLRIINSAFSVYAVLQSMKGISTTTASHSIHQNMRNSESLKFQ
ncbi:CLUMA_CG002373, isoform A [Clunio marinus]|uniref:Odorant receptor n=1 Tax=Clunio marinus TaxID=568069 RepID=A0A1J1HR62_9DIPT|nr:CLUMA_CG002373, isoform A [Clunio marinus]